MLNQINSLLRFIHLCERIYCIYIHTKITKPVSLKGLKPVYFCLQCGRKYEVKW